LPFGFGGGAEETEMAHPLQTLRQYVLEETVEEALG
jgi:hypothetical protein